jgi:hypothetical protein
MSTITNFIFCDIQLSLKYIHPGQTEMQCSHLGNAYSILRNMTIMHLHNNNICQIVPCRYIIIVIVGNYNAKFANYW